MWIRGDGDALERDPWAVPAIADGNGQPDGRRRLAPDRGPGHGSERQVARLDQERRGKKAGPAGNVSIGNGSPFASTRDPTKEPRWSAQADRPVDRRTMAVDSHPSSRGTVRLETTWKSAPWHERVPADAPSGVGVATVAAGVSLPVDPGTAEVQVAVVAGSVVRAGVEVAGVVDATGPVDAAGGGAVAGSVAWCRVTYTPPPTSRATAAAVTTSGTIRRGRVVPPANRRASPRGRSSTSGCSAFHRAA